MPSAASTFRTAEPMLHELLDRVHRGAIQLPDFQRGWVWDDDHIRSLLASITLSYPIGAVMSLETGGEGVRFKPRLFEGVDLDPEPEPEKLILDGQQRLTSLYLALRSPKAVPTRSKHKQPIRVHYFARPSTLLRCPLRGEGHRPKARDGRRIRPRSGSATFRICDERRLGARAGGRPAQLHWYSVLLRVDKPS